MQMAYLEAGAGGGGCRLSFVSGPIERESMLTMCQHSARMQRV